jgi:hypothetical protein
MQKQNDIIESIIAPAVERLSNGVIVENNGVPEWKIAGELYALVGDMQLRQEILGLANFKAPMVPPATNIDLEWASTNRPSRSLEAQASLMECTIPLLVQYGEITKAREVLKAAGCTYKGAVSVPALLRLAVFKFWRTFRCELLAPEYDTPVDSCVCVVDY